MIPTTRNDGINPLTEAQVKERTQAIEFAAMMAMPRRDRRRMSRAIGVTIPASSVPIKIKR